MRIRDELGPLFRDEQFACAFPRRGGPALSPGRLAMVSVLQFAEGLTDRQAADAVRGSHGLEERILDTLLERLSGMGLLRAGGRQRTDSTHVLAA